MGLPSFFCSCLRLGSFQPVGSPDFRPFVFKSLDFPFSSFGLSVFEDRRSLRSASFLSTFSGCLDSLSGVCLWNNFFLIGLVSLLFFRFSLSSVSFRIRSNSGVEVAIIAFPRFLPADLADLGGAYVIEVHK